MGQQFESSTQVVVHQESGTLPPALDLSRMSVGSAVKDIHTGAWTYPDVASGAKIRAPDGLYRLGNSIVSVITSQGPPASTTKQLFGKDGTKWQNTCTLDMLERAINMQQVEMWKMRARAEAQMEEIAGQMEALTVRAETKAAVSQTGMNRERAMEEAAKRDVPQSKPSKDKESSKFPPQNLITPGLIKPPALMNPIEHRPIDVGMLQSLDALVHPFAQLRAYGYTTSNPTAEEIQAVLAKLHGEETCKRCRNLFECKDIAWNKISEDNCVHHPGKCSIEVKGKKLVNGKPMKFWSCCHSRGFEPGCTTGPTHVLEMEDASRLADLCPFESTPSPANTTDNVTKIQKVITLDCEMSYTKYGLALSRMSVLSFPDCKVLEDTFVREPYPGVPFLDYNTQISGVIHENIYPDDPENSPPVLEGITTARSKLWEYCDENTIIIGHGLDHDLKCLRMLHPKIIDTAILFSKIEGQKPGLKKLAEAELRWCIQDVVDLTGHDSVEDCRACIELVLKYLQRPTVAAESPASEIPD